jgi:hypothetical protein
MIEFKLTYEEALNLFEHLLRSNQFDLASSLKNELTTALSGLAKNEKNHNQTLANKLWQNHG